jgi:hypothetical protein
MQIFKTINHQFGKVVVILQMGWDGVNCVWSVNVNKTSNLAASKLIRRSKADQYQFPTATKFRPLNFIFGSTVFRFLSSNILFLDGISFNFQVQFEVIRLL